MLSPIASLFKDLHAITAITPFIQSLTSSQPVGGGYFTALAMATRGSPSSTAASSPDLRTVQPLGFRLTDDSSRAPAS
jgi:hypothetical protein